MCCTFKSLRSFQRGDFQISSVRCFVLCLAPFILLGDMALVAPLARLPPSSTSAEIAEVLRRACNDSTPYTVLSYSNSSNIVILIILILHYGTGGGGTYSDSPPGYAMASWFWISGPRRSKWQQHCRTSCDKMREPSQNSPRVHEPGTRQANGAIANRQRCSHS